MRQSEAAIVHTAAQLKGRRLRMARALTGLSRQELFEKISIATSTIDTWESGRVELSQKSAERVCIALKKVGVYCSAEWLLTGNGHPPRIMDALEKTMMDVGSFSGSHGGEGETVYTDVVPPGRESNKIRKLPSFMDDKIRRELVFFLSLHPGALFHIVERDFLNGRYKVGDCVAGVEENIQSLIGKVIIAVLTGGETILCRLVSWEGKGFGRIFISSEDTGKRVQIVGAAEVIWHRMLKKRG